MFTRSSTLRAVMRASERREEALLAMCRELADRLAHAQGRPWTPPPAPERRIEPLPEPDDGYEEI